MVQLFEIAQFNCNTVFQRVQMTDHHCYCTLLKDVRKNLIIDVFDLSQMHQEFHFGGITTAFTSIMV